jgi:hypothetical protein
VEHAPPLALKASSRSWLVLASANYRDAQKVFITWNFPSRHPFSRQLTFLESVS